MADDTWVSRLLGAAKAYGDAWHRLRYLDDKASTRGLSREQYAEKEQCRRTIHNAEEAMLDIARSIGKPQP